MHSLTSLGTEANFSWGRGPRSSIHGMTTREKVIEIIDRLSEAELEAEYAHLREALAQTSAGHDFDEALEALAAISERVNLSTDAAQLIRDERDWLADRAS
jgi:hypothetical protein